MTARHVDTSTIEQSNFGFDGTETAQLYNGTIREVGLTPRMPNILHTTHAAIGLNRGKYALVSLEDYERINKFVWTYHKDKQERAVRYAGKTLIYMHHEVLQVTGAELTAQGKETDHEDNNTLNNQRYNLRIVTHDENMLNTARHKNRVGVALHKQSGLFIAYVNYPGRMISLGYWKTRERALEISAMGRELQKECETIYGFRKRWKEITPKRNRSTT